MQKQIFKSKPFKILKHFIDMSIRFLKLSLASPESIRSWTERILPNGKRVGKILKGDLIDYKNGLPIRDGLSCERIFGPMVSFTCTCGRFKCIETRGIHIVHDTLRSSRVILPDVSRQNSGLAVKQWGEIEPSFQNPSHSTKLERNREVNPIVSKDFRSKPIKKLVYNQKAGKKLKAVKPIESLILQPITYKQRKMIRFLSDFYYNYQFIYHSNKNDEIIPSFVSIFEEVSSISLSRQKLVAKNFFKQQTVWYPSKKWQISKLFSFLYPFSNKQIVGLKIHSSIIQNLLKPLYKFIFQIYTKFWFDLKLYSNNFIYEKHFFSWVSDKKTTQVPPHITLQAKPLGEGYRPVEQIYDNFRVQSSFFSKFKIRGLYNKSSKLPIIDGILSSQAPPILNDCIKPGDGTVSLAVNFLNIPDDHSSNLSIHNLKYFNYGYSNFLNLPKFLLILKYWPKGFSKIISNPVLFLQKTNVFFLGYTETKKLLTNWYQVSILHDKSCIEYFFKNRKFSDLKPENFLRSKLIQAYSFQNYRSFTPNSASW